MPIGQRPVWFRHNDNGGQTQVLEPLDEAWQVAAASKYNPGRVNGHRRGEAVKPKGGERVHAS